jgi:hypothetical protein
MNAYSFPRQVRERVAVLMTATLLMSLTGCTNIKDDSQRTRTDGAVTGAAAGAAVGAGAGALLKKNKEGALAGAAAGALVGGVAGAAVGDSVAAKKEGYVKKESALDSQLAGLNRQIEGRRTYNAKLREVITVKEQQLATVLASDRSSGPTAEEFDLRTSLTSKISEVDRAARSWQETIDAHKAVLKAASADARGPELEAEISRLAEERTELLRQRARLISINDKLAK